MADPVKVKICGLSTPETLAAALDAGADLVGFVFYGPSPRNVTLERARALAGQVRGRAEKVALVVDVDDDRIGAIVDALAPDYLQAHGTESPDRVRAIAERFGVPVIKAIKVKDLADIRAGSAYDGAARMLLFDAKAPETLRDALPGGNGISFDWTLIDPADGRPSFILSGGLTPENVAESIRVTRAPIVDVSSGVESAPGIKDPARIRNFIAAAKAAR